MTEPYENYAGQFPPEVGYPIISIKLHDIDIWQWSQFVLSDRDDGTVELSVGGANAGLVQGSVWAIVEPRVIPVERDTWIINNHGDGVFTYVRHCLHFFSSIYTDLY